MSDSLILKCFYWVKNTFNYSYNVSYILRGFYLTALRSFWWPSCCNTIPVITSISSWILHLTRTIVSPAHLLSIIIPYDPTFCCPPPPHHWFLPKIFLILFNLFKKNFHICEKYSFSFYCHGTLDVWARLPQRTHSWKETHGHLFPWGSCFTHCVFVSSQSRFFHSTKTTCRYNTVM